MTNPRILVTGASGKTGSHVVAVLLKAGYYIDDHKLGAFELAAPTSDVLDVTGRPAEDFETIARRCAAQPANQRTLGDWVREFMLAPLSPRFNLDRYDRELRRPLPSQPGLAPESTIWRREHANRRFLDVVNWNAEGRRPC